MQYKATVSQPVWPVLSSAESIILNILRIELSNCHTIIFETLSVGKKYDKVKNTPRSLQKVNYICIYVDKKIVVKHQLLHC